MSYIVRRPTEADHVAMVRTFVDVMNQRYPDEEIVAHREGTELDRSWIAVDGDAIVGSATGHTFQLALPGGGCAPLGGLSLVSVVPTHRRLGIMTDLVDRFFADCVERQEPLAGLFASDAGIYGRFGFGAATRMANLTIERDRAAFGTFVPPGRMRWHKAADAADELAPIFERTMVDRPGELARSASTWASLRERATKTPDGKPAWVAIHEPDGGGAPDGYVVYRIESKWIDHTAQNEVHIIELVGVGAVRVALWHFLLNLDLIRTVSDRNARPDEPVADALVDPRQLRIRGIYDQLWLRVLDVGLALAARTYNVTGEVTIEVVDDLLADRGGTFRLVVREAAGGAECHRVEADPQLVVTARALASAYLGDRSFRGLAGAGLVEVRDPAAAALADAMFAVFPRPQCLSTF